MPVVRFPPDAAGNGIGPVGWPCCNGDGSRVVFVCAQDGLDPSDNNGGPDPFVKDTTTGALRLVSRTATGSASRLWTLSGSPASAIDLNRSGTRVVGIHTGIDLTPELNRSTLTYLFSIPASGVD